MLHCVQFSTGAGSAEVAFRVEQIASADDRLVLLTADTMVEDDDNWRFANEIVQALSPRWEWIVIRDGRTPMQVGRDKRVVPNNRLAICSRVLKREALDRWIKHNCDPEHSVIYLGFDWTEPHRFEKAEPLWKPYKISAPLMDAPYIEKSALMDKLRSMGITPPRLYAAGFSHANCGGACVRAGQASWKLLLDWNRERYIDWENEEQTTRDYLGKDVAIMKESVGGDVVPLTLRRFRERIEEQPTLFDKDDWGSCGCFMGDEESK
jgi:hypothetical protein